MLKFWYDVAIAVIKFVYFLPGLAQARLLSF